MTTMTTFARPLALTLIAMLTVSGSGCGSDDGGVDGYVAMSGPGPTDPTGVPTGDREAIPPSPEIAALLLQDTVVVASAPVVNGGFSFRHVAPGRYNVCAALRGTLSDTVSVDVGNDRMTLDRPLEMPDRGMTIANNHPAGRPSVLLFSNAQSRLVTLQVYDRHAKRIRTLMSQSAPAGSFLVQWDLRSDAGTPAPSGWYLVVLQKGPLSPATALAGRSPSGSPIVAPPPTSDSLSWGRGHIFIP